MNVEIVERPEIKAAVLRIPRDGSLVREAWAKVAERLDGHPAVADKEHGYVFIPEWQWATEVTELWVGMLVEQFEGLPEELETLTIPAKKFAKLTVRGERKHMEDAYGYLFGWFEQGPFQRDVGHGSFGFEMNRLAPVNPFEIPADKIDFFDYDIFAPLENGSIPQPLAPDRFPGVIHAEVCPGKTRRIVGSEIFIDQKKVNSWEEIPKFWQTFMPRIGEIADVRQPFATIGLYRYEPPFGPHQAFRYIAGVEVDEASQAPLPEGMTEATIPGDDCLLVTYRGKARGLGQVWDYFHGYWFPQQAEYDAIPDYEFERHDERYLGTDDENSVFEMRFPIRRRARDKRLTDKIVVDEKGRHVLQDLRGEQVRMVSFQDATLHGIDMRDARLRHVNFVGSDWEHIYFAGVRIHEIQMGGTIFEHIRRPDVPESRFEAEPGTDGWVNVEPVVFRESDLSTAKFENCNLSDVNITGCRLDGMTIDGIPVTELLERFHKG
ncbi:effector binding domain-containing protein [Paenibacillus sp. DYY-L-2]|uniref:effector binding domain-containing protein n=1 Tax=Paenibacillus sp. DYY-L-2 TaxID=3447013 RepID=UPI003F504E54